MNIIIINGPNLNLLGIREVEVYGRASFDDYFVFLKNKYNNLSLSYYQSNVEGELINKIQEVGFSYDGIIINPGGYTHTSVAILDAIKAIKTRWGSQWTSSRLRDRRDLENNIFFVFSF